MMDIFSERLRQAREERGMSQSVLAIRVGVRTNDISCYERKIQQPKMSSLVALAQELDCSLDWLCGLSET